MKKFKLILILFIVVFSLSANGQGIKGVEIGDSGLTSPMYGRSSIETTLLGVEGILEVKKYDGKIYEIYFEASYFSQQKVDKLANSLKEKYSISSLEKGPTNTWRTRDNNARVQVIVEQNQSFRRKYIVVTIYDKVISAKAAKIENDKFDNDY